MTHLRIPLSAPDITEPEIEAVAAVLRSPTLSLGPQMHAFEAAFAQLTATPHAIAVSSGTAGLHLAMLAAGIVAGDEVIVPSFAFIAVANCVRYVGATPVFADIDAATLNLDPSAVRRAITPRTRAIIVVHTFGRPAPILDLQSIAREHNLLLIEDACEAIGAEVHGRPVGSFGDIAVFAFYPNKQITTGEGGMVVTANRELADRMRSLRNQGRAATSAWLQNEHLGYNYRLSEIACTLGVGQLARLPEILARREAHARTYNALLANCANLVVPAIDVPGTRVSWFVYVVRLAPHFHATHRDAVIAALQQRGIAAGRYFAPIHLQPAYSAFSAPPLPITESEACRTIALPFFNRLTTEQISEVADTLLHIIAGLPSCL